VKAWAMIGVVAAVLAGATSASAAIHASTFSAGDANCGVTIGAREMGCFSPVLPARSLDGFIQLGPHGHARLTERGDCPFRQRCKAGPKLRRGQDWERVGVMCHHGRVLRCENKDAHGFVLRRHSYRRF
jgi:hypothetical protein